MDQLKVCFIQQQAVWFRAQPDHPSALLEDNAYYAFNETLQFSIEQGLPAALLALALAVVLFRAKAEKEESIKLNSIERNISLNLVNAGSENSYGGLCCQWLNRGCHHPNGWSFADALWIGSSDFCP